MGLNIPVNRIVAFLKPYLDWVSALVASWLVGIVNVLGIPGLDRSNIATYFTSALVFLIVAALHAIGNLSWFKGHHIIVSAAATKAQTIDPLIKDELNA